MTHAHDTISKDYPSLTSPEAITELLSSAGYISDDQISTSLFLAANLQKPILIEGPAGVGKTELAKALAAALDLPVHRLQCYEGLDEGKALYEWKYGKQLLYTQILKDRMHEIVGEQDGFTEVTKRLEQFEDIFFSPLFLDARPLLRALQRDAGSVLLIDEIDKSDEEFEAFLLEVLSDYQVTVPELGTIEAKTPPIVILTSNNVRDLGDALKRRCLHLYIGFPDAAREREIVKARVPEVADEVLRQLVTFVQGLREADIKKKPSISETVDWARTLILMHADALDKTLVRQTLNVLLKYESDIQAVEASIHQRVREARSNVEQRLPPGYPGT